MADEQTGHLSLGHLMVSYAMQTCAVSKGINNNRNRNIGIYIKMQ